MRAIYVSTYIPQKCGIATFTKDVTTAINMLNPYALAEIMAIVKEGEENLEFPWEVKCKIKRNELLPAGIIFIGGGSNVSGLEDLSKSFLNLPSSIGSTEMFGNIKTKLRDQSWFVALGLIISSKDKNITIDDSTISNFFKDIKNTLKSTMKQLMP